MWDLVFYLYEGMLLVYTGWRTYDFMSNQLPKGGDGVLNILLSLAFLAATEFGLIMWHFLSRKHANTSTQEKTADTLTWLDFGASFGAGVADMVLHQTLLEGYVLPPIIGYVLLYGLPLVVAANVGAGLIYKKNDAQEILRRKEKQAEFAKTDLEIEILDQTIRSLSGQKRTAANRIKGDAAGVMEREVLRRIANEFGLDGKNYGGPIDLNEPPEPPEQPNFLVRALGTLTGGNSKTPAPKAQPEAQSLPPGEDHPNA
jgi:hypothetical protein